MGQTLKRQGGVTLGEPGSESWLPLPRNATQSGMKWEG